MLLTKTRQECQNGLARLERVARSSTHQPHKFALSCFLRQDTCTFLLLQLYNLFSQAKICSGRREVSTRTSSKTSRMDAAAKLRAFASTGLVIMHARR